MRIVFFLFCNILLLCGCELNRTPINLPSQFSQNMMTIDYHIMVGDRLTPLQKHQIQSIIDSTFQEIDSIYNKWNPRSELSLLNAFSDDMPFALSPQLYQFLQRLDSLVKLSGGRFDPTVEPLQKLWKDKLDQGIFPSTEELEELRKYVGWHTLRLENGRLYKTDKRTQLDLGGVAKGLCVDLIIERLNKAGFQHLYVDWGGEIRTLGFHPSQRPWRIYISSLGNHDPTKAVAQLDLINQAIATSGDYYQYWTIQGESGQPQIFCHIFNPLTLLPLEVKAGTVASASLLAHDCVTADALAKVLMLFDTVEEAQIWIKKIQLLFPHLASWIVTRTPNHSNEIVNNPSKTHSLLQSGDENDEYLIENAF